MPVTCQVIDGKHRLVEAESGAIAKNASGSALDGSGHDTRDACMAQARAVNSGLAFVLSVPDSEPYLHCAEHDGLTFDKQLIYVGQFTAPHIGKFSVTEADIDDWVATHNLFSKRGVKVPLPKEHTNDPEASRGEVLLLRKGTDKKGRVSLYGKVKFRDAEAAKMSRGSSNVSIYVPPESRDGLGNVYKKAIRHVALTDYPVIPDLGEFVAVAASLVLGDDSMSLRALAEKLGLDGDDARDDVAISSAVTKMVGDLKAEIKDLKQKLRDKKPDEPTKKPDEPTKEPVKVAASLIGMARELRESKIDKLVPEHISPAVAKDLKTQFCTDEGLALSLQDGAKDDGFNALLLTLAKNEVVKPGEKTGAQALACSLKAEDNPVIRNAEERAKAVGAAADGAYSG